MTLRLSTGVRQRQLGVNTTKVTNGEFTTNITGWTGSNATPTCVAGGQSGNMMTVTNTGGAAGYAANTAAITVIVGHIYQFTGYFKKGTGTSGKFTIGTLAGGAQYYDSGNLTDADWVQYTACFRATTTSVYISCHSNEAATNSALFDTLILVDKANSIQDMFYKGQIEIRSGSQPATADAAPTGTLLVTILSGGVGITFGDAVSGVLPKTSTETWSAACVATNTAGWFRLCLSTDLGTLNYTDVRIDGSITTIGGGGDMEFTSTAFVTSAVQTITDWQLTDPLE